MTTATNGAQLSAVEAWHLERRRRGLGDPDPAKLRSALAREIAAAMHGAADPDAKLYAWVQASANGTGPAIFAALFAVDVNAPEPPEAPVAARYTLHCADEALLPQPPINWVIDRLISRPSVNVFAGPPGSLKTWLILSLLVSTSLRLPWLGKATSGGSTLLVDEESGLARSNDRIARVMAGHNAGPGTPFFYTTLSAFNLRDSGDVQHFDDLLGQVQPATVGIDALVDIMPAADENAVKDVQPVVQTLRRLAEKHCTAINLLHHTNRAGGYRGSTAISGGVDLLLMVQRRDGTTSTVDLKTEKARDLEPFSLAAEVVFDDVRQTVSVVPVGQGKPAATYSKAEEFVIRYLTAKGAALVADIEANADSCSARSARNAIYALAGKQIIRRSGAGGRGAPAMYELVPGAVRP